MLVLKLLLQRFRSYAAEWKLDLQRKVTNVNNVKNKTIYGWTRINIKIAMHIPVPINQK
jgi:hypothetical protein